MSKRKCGRRMILIGIFSIWACALAEGAAEKSPLPSVAEQQTVGKQLDEIYELSKKQTDEKNLALAKELFALSRESRSKPAEQFVLARKAMELARDGGDAMFMLQAIGFLGDHFQLDPLMVKGKMLRSFADGAVDKDRMESLLKASRHYVDEALAAKRYDYALSVAVLMFKAAQRPAGREFRKAALDLRKSVQKLYDDHQKFESATLAVKANPDDGDAHLALGRLYCFSRNDWPRGLSHLIKGSDATLALLAKQDDASPSDVAEQVKLGDAWWNLAESRSRDEKTAMLLRAGSWYEKARPTATGLKKAKMNKRLAEIAKLGQPATGPKAPKPVSAWPGKVPGLVLAWMRGAKNLTTPPGAGKWSLQPRGAAKLDARGAMVLGRGAVIVHGGNDALLTACKASNQLTVEAVLTAANLEQDGPARIISFSTDGHSRNFTLGQNANRLVFRLRTPSTGTNGSKPETTLCRFTAGVPHHVVVSYQPGKLVCYLNGQQVHETSAVQGDFSNWTAQQILFGDEWKDRRDWSGTIELVSISSQFVDLPESQRRFKAAQTALKPK